MAVSVMNRIWNFIDGTHLSWTLWTTTDWQYTEQLPQPFALVSNLTLPFLHVDSNLLQT